MAPARPNQFKMMLSDEELETLRELAEAKGLTASDFLRTLIREQADSSGVSEGSLGSMLKTFERIAALSKGAKGERASAAAEKLQRVQKKLKR